MKNLRLFLGFALAILLVITWGSPLSARAAADPDTVQLKVDNKTGQVVYLNLKGPKNYYQAVGPGITKFDVEKGKYSFTYYACGSYQEGTLDVNKANTKLILPGCGSSKSGKSATVKLRINNKTGKELYINLNGPAKYYLLLNPGVTKLDVEKGRYTFSYYHDCGGYQEGMIEIKKANTKLVLPGCGAKSASKNSKLMKFTVMNETGGYITLKLTGPQAYSFNLPSGKTVLEVVKGKYQYTAWGCGGSSVSGTVSSGKKIKFFCIRR